MNSSHIFWPVLAQIFLTVAVFIVLGVRKAGTGAVVLAWLFIASRYAHAYVHLGSNYVPLRMRLFIIGFVVLLAMLLVAAWKLAT